MDPVLKALNDYKETASAQQKAADLARLETECLSEVDAAEYIASVESHFGKSRKNH